LLVVEAASRGWVPMFRVSSYNRTDLIMEMVPILIAAAWLFFALMACASAFASDRSTGKESFLLERPVSRVTIWKARLLATVLNSLMVMLSGWIVWAGFSLMLAEPVEGIFMQASSLLLSVGGVLVVMVICGGLAASALIDSPMLAFLGGGLLAAAPFGAGVFLAGVSPFAIVFNLEYDVFPAPLLFLSRLPIGMILPMLLFPVYVFASYQILCKGEPAGRGRRQRGGKVLVPAVVGVFVLFLILAPLAVRANANHSISNGMGRILPSPAAGRVVVTGDYSQGGWLIDTVNARKMRFFHGDTTFMAWRADSALLAVVHEGKAFNWSGRSRSSLKIVDGETGENQGEMHFPRELELRGVEWTGKKVLLAFVDWEELKRGGNTDHAGDLVHFYLAEEGNSGWKNGRIREMAHQLPIQGISRYDWQIFTSGPSTDQVFLSTAITTGVGTSVGRTNEDLLHSVTVGRLTLGESSLIWSPIGQFSGDAWRASHFLSPSGGYSWILRQEDPAMSIHMELYDFEARGLVELEHIEGAQWPVWLNDDELLWVQIEEDRGSLHRWKPGEELSTLMEFDASDRLSLDRSPDREHLFLSLYSLPDHDQNVKSSLKDTWIYQADSGEVRPSKMNFQGTAWGSYYSSWADPETIMWGDDGRIYLERIDHPGEPVVLN
jgi:hypothetical protein